MAATESKSRNFLKRHHMGKKSSESNLGFNLKLKENVNTPGRVKKSRGGFNETARAFDTMPDEPSEILDL